MPNFGQFKEEKHQIKQEVYKRQAELNVEEKETKKNVLSAEQVKKVKDFIGAALDKIGNYNDLNNQEHVVALIDEVDFFLLFKINFIKRD